MNPDGLSYLDLASDALKGGPSKLVNGYWSPGYPALLSIALLLIHPSPAQEFPLIHAVNVLVFLFALWSFSFFLRHWLSTFGDEIETKKRSYLTPFAFATFLWITLTLTGVECVSPDLGVAGIVFLAAGISCRLSLPEASWTHHVALGVVLGAGYYLKAALFPISMAFLAILFAWSLFSNGVSRHRLGWSLSAFLLVAAPLLTGLSVRAHRPTIGETGRLNYAWYVNGLLWSGGLEPPPPDTTPDHPAPQLLSRPMTLKFAAPIGGTYPLWYDPSYWYADANVHFDFHQQLAALKQTLQSYRDIADLSMTYIMGALALCGLILHRKLRLTVGRSLWWLLAWSLAAMSIYAFVHVEGRFVGAFLVLFWLSIYGALTFRVDRKIAAAVSAAVLCTVMVPFTIWLTMEGVRAARDLFHPQRPEYQTVAAGLTNLGLHPGDRLAVVGYAYNCYYARFARLRVVAQIPDTKEFWRLSAPDLRLLAGRLSSIGVKAVVAFNRPDRPDASMLAYWKGVKVSDSLRLSVLFVSPETLGKTE
jgi:hypothetical protein